MHHHVRRVKRLIVIQAAIVLLILCVQLLYPYESALPLAKVRGESVAFQKQNDLSAMFQRQFEEAHVQVSSGARTVSLPLTKLGASVNAERMSEQLVQYPLWQRFIPFSLLFKWPQVEYLDISYDGDQVTSATAGVASQLSSEPVDASLSINNATLQVVAAQNGYHITANEVRDALIAARYSTGTTKVAIASRPITPARLDSDISVVTERAKALIATPVALVVADKGTYTADAPTKTSWLRIAMQDKVATLTIDHDSLKQFVKSVNDKVKLDPIATTVTIVDGNETGRVAGTAGATLDIDGLTAELEQSLAGPTPRIERTVSLQSVAPSIVYKRSYTNSEAGLRAYVTYATSTQNVRIVVQQLGGEGWSASGRADESLPSASTYKLFVAKMLFAKMDEGTVHWDDPMLDTTVSGCFDRMTIASTNPCAVEWLTQFGRETMNNYVYSLGFSTGTTFTHPEAVHTTASDLTKFMIGLENGSLVSGAYRDRLLHSLSTHTYRYGIPTGVKGTVYDKVGFLWDYVHDTAIVYGPKGSYVLTIMTKGYSYAYIANVARQIEQIMYP